MNSSDRKKQIRERAEAVEKKRAEQSEVQRRLREEFYVREEQRKRNRKPPKPKATGRHSRYPS